jgi:hypothetical protein
MTTLSHCSILRNWGCKNGTRTLKSKWRHSELRPHPFDLSRSVSFRWYFKEAIGQPHGHGFLRCKTFIFRGCPHQPTNKIKAFIRHSLSFLLTFA